MPAESRHPGSARALHDRIRPDDAAHHGSATGPPTSRQLGGLVLARRGHAGCHTTRGHCNRRGRRTAYCPTANPDIFLVSDCLRARSGDPLQRALHRRRTRLGHPGQRVFDLDHHLRGGASVDGLRSGLVQHRRWIPVQGRRQTGRIIRLGARHGDHRRRRTQFDGACVLPLLVR